MRVSIRDPHVLPPCTMRLHGVRLLAGRAVCLPVHQLLPTVPAAAAAPAAARAGRLLGPAPKALEQRTPTLGASDDYLATSALPTGQEPRPASRHADPLLDCLHHERLLLTLSPR